MAASSSMTRMRGFIVRSVDLDGVRGALQRASRACRRRTSRTSPGRACADQAAVVRRSTAPGCRLISSSTCPRSMSRVEGRAHRLHARHDRRPPCPSGARSAAANSRSISRTDRPSAGPVLLDGCGRSSRSSRRWRSRSGRSASFTGTFIGRPSRSTCSVAVVPGCRAAISWISSIVAGDRLAVHRDDHVVGAQPGPRARRAGRDVLHQRAARRAVSPSDRCRSGSTSRSATPM